jgi:hypothetical protein
MRGSTLLLDDDFGVLSSLRLSGWSVFEPPDTAIFSSMSLRKSLSIYFSSSLLEERLMDIDDPVKFSVYLLPEAMFEKIRFEERAKYCFSIITKVSVMTKI